MKVQQIALELSGLYSRAVDLDGVEVAHSKGGTLESLPPENREGEHLRCT